ncbi:trypsin-1-like [Condylostylus longicornis]|uniref:trypsin-1-like n=1 Tax=Condylostylus longicornis TaxID=2530218 RepID=UPI00244DFE7C|nr:trypsin-1-like [Condylostylus longicornis]
MLRLLYLLSLVFMNNANTSRVIGGNYASPGQFPYQVALQLNGRHHCGGAIISETAILTAAHCTINQSPQSMMVIAGTTDIQDTDGIRIQPSRFINHPQYSSQTNDYDISIIQLSQPLPIGNNIKPINMVDVNDNFDADTIGTLSGWGAIDSNLQLPTKLKYAKIQLWSRDYCNPQNIPGITDRMICAGHPSGQISACQGDSGGPLTVNEKLAGVVSWGFGCGAAGRPAMYTFVGTFRPWIKQTVGV